MPTSTPPPPERPNPTAHRTRSLPFDRLVILLLGACACVLSFDSLRQVALATHVRPDLSYLFPVVIDGFIAYGVRARTAPSARGYLGRFLRISPSARQGGQSRLPVPPMPRGPSAVLQPQLAGPSSSGRAATTKATASSGVSVRATSSPSFRTPYSPSSYG